MCTGPLYSGWICAWYSARNLSWRSVGLWLSTSSAMGSSLRVPALIDHTEKLLVLALVDAVAMVVVRKFSCADIGGVGLQARDRHLGEVGVALGELGLEVGEHTEQ